MQNDAAEVKLSCRLDEIAGDHSTKGGSSETEAKEFAVIPKGPCAVFTVTTVTPVPLSDSQHRHQVGADDASHRRPNAHTRLGFLPVVTEAKYRAG